MWALHITHHKRVRAFDTHPSFCFAKTSFMLETSGEIVTLEQLYNEKERW